MLGINENGAHEVRIDYTEDPSRRRTPYSQISKMVMGRAYRRNEQSPQHKNNDLSSKRSKRYERLRNVLI